ncbi:MAG: drug/metabolite transporter (DMT)-like permease [Paraglaciecola sp.]|jgi:drug/metabolite transporter (DMT)-like permease
MTTSVRHWYGFSLSLLVAFMWGVLPVFIKLCLQSMDAVTITWYRFAVAGSFVFILLWRKRALPAMRVLIFRKKIWLLVASLLLVANFVSNVKGLGYLSPETTLVIMQLAPFLLMMGGIVFYGERFTVIEKCGAVVLFSGLLLFFNDSLGELVSSLDEYTVGVLFVVFSAFCWAAYALMQKPLLRVLSARQLTLMIYLLGILVLLPFTQLTQLMDMDALQVFALLFCCVNTIIAYGAFTEALHVWQASKVSAVISLAPIFTFISMLFAVTYLPQHFVPSELDIWAYIGGGTVVLGSALTALGKTAKA